MALLKAPVIDDPFLEQTGLLPEAAPLTLAPLDTLYVLFYRHGSNPHTQSIHFSFPGEFKKAIDRGRKFCDVTGYRFIKVEQFLTNLDEREKRMQE